MFLTIFLEKYRAVGRNSLQRNKAKVTNTTGCIMILKIPPNVPHTNTNAISAIDTMGRMHSDAQFAGSSSVPAHVEMMGFLGIGNNPMVGCTVACAVDVATALNK